MYMKLVQLNNEIYKFNQDIIKLCNDIHPKLLRRVNVKSFNDMSLYDDSLEDQFHEKVIPEYKKAKAHVHEKCNEILQEYLNIMFLLRNDNEHEIGIFSSTGESVTAFNLDEIDISTATHNVIFDLGIESFITKLASLLNTSLKLPKPFWDIHGYNIRGSNESVSVVTAPNNSPKNFMEFNKKKLKHGTFFSEPGSVALLKAVRTIDKLQNVAIGPCEDFVINNALSNHIITCAVNHVILDEVLKSDKGYGQYTVIIDDEFNVSSTEQVKSW